MKTLIPVLATSLFLLSGCDVPVNSWGPDGELANGLARFNGTVEDTPLTAEADLVLNTFDDEFDGGMNDWIDLSATTAWSDGTMGMMYVMGNSDLETLFAPGRRTVTPMSEGGSIEVLLCGETRGAYYDETAEEVIVEVEETDDGGRDVLFRGEVRNGKRFQEIRFHVNADLVPAVANDPTEL